MADPARDALTAEGIEADVAAVEATPVIRDHVGPLVSQAHEAVNLAIERDRLRAVVEAARVQCAAADAFWGESFTSGARRALNDADEALRAALAALDAPEPEA